MGLVRGIMREAGAANQSGLQQTLRTPGFEPTAESVELKKFMSNSDWLISPAECRFIAGRLKKAIPANIIGELFSFHDDAPPKAPMIPKVDAWADFNTRAATRAAIGFADQKLRNRTSVVARDAQVLAHLRDRRAADNLP